MSHYVIKLSCGEIVYGMIDAKKSDTKIVVLEDPMVFEDFQTQDGYMSSALVKYMSGSKDEPVPVATTHITSMVRMSDAFSAYYDAAVACNKITEESYVEKLAYMTQKMMGLVIDHQLKEHADQTDSIAFYTESDSSTIH